MNMNKIKDEVFVVNQPAHPLVSIIFVDTKFPLTDNIHNNIFKLCDISDVVFVFSNKYYSGNKKVNKMKFSSLYSSCAWISSKDSLPRTLLKYLEYDTEIFNKHVGFMFMNASDLEKVNVSDSNLEETTIKLMTEDIIKPIFKLDRLSSLNLYDIYNLDEEEEEEESEVIEEEKQQPNFFEKCKNFFYSIFKSNKSVNREEDIENKFSTYKTSSELVFLKGAVIKRLLDYKDSDEDKRLSFIDSFNNSDIRYFIASIVKQLKLDIYDVNLVDLKL